MKIIPHPAELKRKERALIKAYSDLSYKMCEAYSLEISIKERLEKVKKKEREIITRSLFCLSLGILIGYFLRLLV